MSEPYKTCPDCGAHLDPGESCDCRSSSSAPVHTEETRDSVSYNTATGGNERMA